MVVKSTNRSRFGSDLCLRQPTDQKAGEGYSPVVYNTYSVKNYNGEDLFVHALQDTVPEITKEIERNGEAVRVQMCIRDRSIMAWSIR